MQVKSTKLIFWYLVIFATPHVLLLGVFLSYREIVEIRELIYRWLIGAGSYMECRAKRIIIVFSLKHER